MKQLGSCDVYCISYYVDYNRDYGSLSTYSCTHTIMRVLKTQIIQISSNNLPTHIHNDLIHLPYPLVSHVAPLTHRFTLIPVQNVHIVNCFLKKYIYVHSDWHWLHWLHYITELHWLHVAHCFSMTGSQHLKRLLKLTKLTKKEHTSARQNLEHLLDR